MPFLEQQHSDHLSDMDRLIHGYFEMGTGNRFQFIRIRILIADLSPGQWYRLRGKSDSMRKRLLKVLFTQKYDWARVRHSDENKLRAKCST